jgi:hypothetical protein
MVANHQQDKKFSMASTIADLILLSDTGDSDSDCGLSTYSNPEVDSSTKCLVKRLRNYTRTSGNKKRRA